MLKMLDQMSGLENVGPEFVGLNVRAGNVGPENERPWYFT